MPGTQQRAAAAFRHATALTFRYKLPLAPSPEGLCLGSRQVRQTLLDATQTRITVAQYICDRTHVGFFAATASLRPPQVRCHCHAGCGGD